MLGCCWSNVQMLRSVMFAGCSVQIGGDNRKGALHVIDDISLARVDIAYQDPPASLLAGIGDFPPEAQNENLIEQRFLRFHARTIAWSELGAIPRSSGDARFSVTSDSRSASRPIRIGSRHDHGAERRTKVFARRRGLPNFWRFGGRLGAFACHLDYKARPLVAAHQPRP